MARIKNRDENEFLARRDFLRYFGRAAKASVFVILAFFIFPTASLASILNILSGFSVIREIDLFPDQLSIPRALLKASDGGYLVLGKEAGGWVAKTDSHGGLAWVFSDDSMADGVSKFLAAAAAPDGGVLLCGERRYTLHDPKDIGGILVRLNSEGKEINRIDPYGQKSSPDSFISSFTCSSWGAGFAVLGEAVTSNADANEPAHSKTVLTLMRLDANGNLIWQKRIQSGVGLLPESRELANGDLLVFWVSQEKNVAVFDSEGNIRDIATINPECKLLHEDISDRAQFICKSGEPSVHLEIITVDSNLKVLRKMPVGPVDMNIANGCVSRGGGYVLFGYTRGDILRFVPIVVELAPDGAVVDKYRIHGLDEVGITDGISTGVPGEYAMVRPKGEPSGTFMTFIRQHKK